MTTFELKPCPFCGSEKISVVTWSSNRFPGVYCNNCPGATVHHQYPQAIDAWNRRAGFDVSVPKESLPIEKPREFWMDPGHLINPHNDNTVYPKIYLDKPVTPGFILFREVKE